MSDRLLILGASARSAAFSAIRAGYVPLAADSFGDADLLACCCVRRVGNYPAGLVAAAEAFPPCPWMYLGALENHPRLVDRISNTRPLLGNPGHVLREIRNPFQVADALRRAGLPCLDVSRSAPRTGDGHWVSKPFRSAGGSRIAFLQDPTLDSQPSTRDSQPATLNSQPSTYFQRFVPGTPCSAVYVAAGRRATFLGATRQLIGTRWTGACGFQYAGSLGPIPLAERTQRFFEAIGNCLAERFALVGLFGVDAVLADGAVWLIEVNPRYTASVEVLEQALDTKLLPLHVHACQHQEIPATSLQTPSHYVGKAVVYATQAVTIPDAFGELVARYPTGPPWPTLADVPPGGTAISPGQPVLTVIATGHRLVGVYHQLRNLVRQVQGGVGCEEAP